MVRLWLERGARWGVTAAFAVFLLATVFGFWWSAGFGGDFGSWHEAHITANRGMILVQVFTFDDARSPVVDLNSGVWSRVEPMIWWHWPWFDRRAYFGFRHGTSLNLPIWFPTFFLGSFSLVMWRRHMRLVPGHCRCGYSLTGLTAVKCPECGREIARAKSRRQRQGGLMVRLWLERGVRWGATAAFAVFLLATILGLWLSAAFGRDAGSYVAALTLDRGMIHAQFITSREAATAGNGWLGDFGQRVEPMIWWHWPWFESGSNWLLGHGTSLYVPIWCPTLLLGLIAIALWWRFMRPLPGHCFCGYSYIGLTAAKCPECGRSTLDGASKRTMWPRLVSRVKRSRRQIPLVMCCVCLFTQALNYWRGAGISLQVSQSHAFGVMVNAGYIEAFAYNDRYMSDAGLVWIGSWSRDSAYAFWPIFRARYNIDYVYSSCGVQTTVGTPLWVHSVLFGLWAEYLRRRRRSQAR